MATDIPRSHVFSRADWLNTPAGMARLQESGWVVIEDVPAAKAEVELALARLGALQPQYSGLTFWDVIPKSPGKGTSIGDRELSFHTELAEFADPPRYVALYCLRPAVSGGALKLLDLRPVLEALSAAKISVLMQEPVTVYCEDEIARAHGNIAFTAPVLSRRDGQLAVRYDPPQIDASTPASLRDFADRILTLGEQHLASFVQQAESLAIWDNWRIVHGRTAFEGTERHLWRCCVKPPTAPS